MNGNEDAVELLKRLVSLQEEANRVRQRSLELQEQALENQARAVRNAASGLRLYRIALFIGALLISAIGVGIYYFYSLPSRAPEPADGMTYPEDAGAEASP